MTDFIFSDKLSVPTETAALHTTIANQSINVLCDTSSHEHRLIRLLLGTVKITHSLTGKKWDQGINYSILGAPISKTKTIKGLGDLLGKYDLTSTSVDRHLRSNLKLQDYYSNLATEMCSAIMRMKLQQHTIAFLHIYRFLERISYAFPLLYAARSRDFHRSFTKLRDYFSGDKGELGFFKIFVTSAIDSVILGQSVKISFSHVNLAHRASVFAAVLKQVDSTCIASQVLDTEFDIKVAGILELIINLRNRFFHFLSTNPSNLTMSEVKDSDELFSCVNEVALNWLSMLYFEVLKHQVQLLE